jgi:hypothetical protein
MNEVINKYNGANVTLSPQNVVIITISTIVIIVEIVRIVFWRSLISFQSVLENFLAKFSGPPLPIQINSG